MGFLVEVVQGLGFRVFGAIQDSRRPPSPSSLSPRPLVPSREWGNESGTLFNPLEGISRGI